MEEAVKQAIMVLKNGRYTCVFWRERVVYFSNLRGVLPLLLALEENADVKNAVAADRVVGGAAAFLYLLLGTKRLHALVISRRALEVLEANGVCVTYDTIVDGIKNRGGNGPCPMEAATMEVPVNQPRLALARIKETLASLKNAQN